MAQFIIVVMGDDPDDDAVAASHEMAGNFVAALKGNDVRIFEATYITVAGDGARFNLEADDDAALDEVDDDGIITNTMTGEPFDPSINIDVQDSNLGLSSPDA